MTKEKMNNLLFMLGDEVITEYICQQSYFQRLCQDVLLKYQPQNILGIWNSSPKSKESQFFYSDDKI